MKKTKSILSLTIVSFFLLINCGTHSSREANDTVAFVNVNIIPMDSERILEQQTVIIRKGQIEHIGPYQETKIPSNVKQIDGSGRYLMPGLADMHAHIEHEDALILFLANGVTTVRNMWGFSKHLSWKQKILEGKLAGPTIYTAGSLFDGPPGIWNKSILLDQPENAEQYVKDQKTRGYDFIKIYYLQKNTFNALLAAAQKHDMPVIGHVSDAVGLKRVLTSGQYSIEHLDGYWMLLESDDSPFRNKFDYHSYIMRWNHIDKTRMGDAAALTKSSGIWNCPTLVVYQRNASPAEVDSFYGLPEMKYMDPVSLASWDPTTYFVTKNLSAEEWQADAKMFPTLLELTGHLYKAGAKLVLGTDTPNPFVVPGFSVHTELKNFVKAGMSPYEAIKTGTYNAAECLKSLHEFGTIQTGKRADLILLTDNPLEDVANITHRCGVMVRGQWFTEDELQAKLKNIASSYFSPQNRFDNIPPLGSKNSMVQQGQYELTYNGILFGEERFALFASKNGGFTLISQTVTDRPYATKTLVRMSLDPAYFCTDIEYENQTSTGKNLLTFNRTNNTLKITGALEGNEQILKNIAISKEELISPPRASVCVSSVPVMASYLQLIQKMQHLRIGDSLKVANKSLQLNYPFMVQEEQILVKRIADTKRKGLEKTVTLRVFNLIITSNNAKTKSMIFVDSKGQLVSLEIKQQIGELAFNLKK